MLVEHYEPDKLFEEVVGYLPEIAAELVKIDAYLEDVKLFRMIQKDLSKLHPKTCQTGRNSTPVEVILWRQGATGGEAFVRVQLRSDGAAGER